MPQQLNDYVRQLQRLVRDGDQRYLDPQDLVEYLNRARRQVCMQSQCLRALSPSAGRINAINVTATGSGYAQSTTTVTISAPDSPSGNPINPNGAQAIANATVIGGKVQAVNVTYGGDGYFMPTVTITGAGTGATATANVVGVNQTVYNQEVYPFTQLTFPQNPGYGSIHGIRSVSIIYAGYRYSLPMYSFSVYQAKVRNYPRVYQFVPQVCSQYGQGTAGSLYMFPLASQAWQIEIDAYFLPQDLTINEDYEAVPDPWSDAVPWFAGFLAMTELQNLNAAAYMKAQYDDFMHRYRAYVSPGRQTNPYGIW